MQNREHIMEKKKQALAREWSANVVGLSEEFYKRTSDRSHASFSAVKGCHSSCATAMCHSARAKLWIFATTTS